MGEIIVTMALGGSVLGALMYSVWWLDRLIKQRTESLQDSASAQGHRLTVVSAELQFARKEIQRLQSEVSVVRGELSDFIHGPPSLKRPPAQQAV